MANTGDPCLATYMSRLLSNYTSLSQPSCDPNDRQSRPTLPVSKFSHALMGHTV